jgi:S1-C subfamily serine protease
VDLAAAPRLIAPRVRVLRLAAAVGVVVAIILGTPTATIPARFDFQPISAQRAAQVIRPSTVLVLAFGCNLQRREGTAVAVGPGRLVTNQHVVGQSRLVDLVADGYPTTVADVPSVATAGDVATLSAAGLRLPSIPLAPQDPLVGSSVSLAGYPSVPDAHLGPGLVIERLRVVDYVAGATVGEPWPVMRLNGSSRPGMSGGPVLDDSGRLAGIVFGNEIPSGDALVVPVAALRKLLVSGAFVAGGC